MKWRVSKTGTGMIIASTEEEAIQKAEEMPVEFWDWERAEADED